MRRFTRNWNLGNKIMNDKFSHLIGQHKLKSQLSFYLQAFEETQVLPHVLLVGGKGAGKTEFAIALAKNLKCGRLSGKPKPLLTINSSTLKNLKQFVEDIYLKYVNDASITILLDEIHALPDQIQTALLTILNPNKKNCNVFHYEESELMFDFTKVSFIFATTDPQKLIGPFKDRCRMLHMEEYEHEDLAMIVRSNIDEGLFIEDDAIEDVASVCRGNARNAVLMAKDNITQYMKANKVKSLNKPKWKHLCSILSIRPLGLEESEVSVLKALGECVEGSSLNNLAAKTGYTRGAIQLEYEAFLVKKNLMSITPSGRKITYLGRKYLNDHVLSQREAA